MRPTPRHSTGWTLKARFRDQHAYGPFAPRHRMTIEDQVAKAADRLMEALEASDD